MKRVRRVEVGGMHSLLCLVEGFLPHSAPKWEWALKKRAGLPFIYCLYLEWLHFESDEPNLEAAPATAAHHRAAHPLDLRLSRTLMLSTRKQSNFWKEESVGCLFALFCMNFFAGAQSWSHPTPESATLWVMHCLKSRRTSFNKCACLSVCRFFRRVIKCEDVPESFFFSF